MANGQPVKVEQIQRVAPAFVRLAFFIALLAAVALSGGNSGNEDAADFVFTRPGNSPLLAFDAFQVIMPRRVMADGDNIGLQPQRGIAKGIVKGIGDNSRHSALDNAKA